LTGYVVPEFVIDCALRTQTGRIDRQQMQIVEGDDIEVPPMWFNEPRPPDHVTGVDGGHHERMTVCGMDLDTGTAMDERVEDVGVGARACQPFTSRQVAYEGECGERVDAPLAEASEEGVCGE
jgi:hypothetical protein